MRTLPRRARGSERAHSQEADSLRRERPPPLRSLGRIPHLSRPGRHHRHHRKSRVLRAGALQSGASTCNPTGSRRSTPTSAGQAAPPFETVNRSSWSATACGTSTSTRAGPQSPPEHADRVFPEGKDPGECGLVHATPSGRTGSGSKRQHEVLESEHPALVAGCRAARTSPWSARAE